LTGELLPHELEKESDEELVRLARAGDESAFAEIVRRYGPRVFRVASRFFRRREQAEEVAQEVFLKAFTQLEAFEGRGSLEGWLARIAANTCLNLIRGARRRPEMTVADLTEDETAWLDLKLADVAGQRHRAAERAVVAADLAERVLATLSPEDRTVLMLIDGEGTPVKDVAELMGWSESNVKVRAFRARRKMREAVERLLARGGRRKRFESAGEG
jgi:RNA polymerase sigma-70 factor (ECF subfamily)